MNYFVLFSLCTLANVVLSTIRSLATVNGGKWSAAWWNAVCYGFYTYIIILTSGDGIPVLAKMGITFAANFIGVFVIKFIEEKKRAIKLWKVELTIPKRKTDMLHHELKKYNIPHYFNEIHKWTVFNIFCETEAQSEAVKKIANQYDAKYFVSETKEL